MREYLGDVIGEPMVPPRHVYFKTPSHRRISFQRGLHVLLATIGCTVIGGLIVMHLLALFWYAPVRILAVE